jgi:hypothetical protein
MVNKLPDFDDLQTIINEIATLEQEVGERKIELDVAEGQLTQKALTDTTMYINQKAPSMDYTRTAILAIDAELVKRRLEINTLDSVLKYKKAYYALELLKIEIWRTQSANERKSLL